MTQLALSIAVCAIQLVPAPELSTGAVDADASSRAFVEIVARRTVVYEREVLPLVLRIGVESGFARTNLLQLFVQRLDLPVQVEAPWFTQPIGAEWVRRNTQEMPDLRESFTFALDDEVVRGVRRTSELRGGREFAVLELEREFLIERSGEFVVPAPSARFAFTTSFETDFFLDPRAVDWRLADVRGPSLTLRVAPLPESDRPTGFAGAVGVALAIQAETLTRGLTVGSHFTLRVMITGDGNLEFFAAPRFAELDGFDIYGVLDEKTRERRTFEIDLAPRSMRVAGVPALEFAYFDSSEPPQFRVVRSLAIPLDVQNLSVAERSAPGISVSWMVFALPVLLLAGAIGVVGLVWSIVRRSKRSKSS